jgi:16S rRNA (adenine1518-N6/adenine1519-N6)-dimethyltransferase
VGSEQAASGAAEPRLLGSTDIRALAARYQIRPARRHGQNFVVDPNTVRRIVRTAALEPDDVVLEVGPGLGSLTLELLTRAAGVIAVEVVAVPVVLHVLELLPTATRGLVMVQLEVAQRLAATPGSRTYGIPSVKAAWYAQLRQAGQVSRSVFWPPPRVDSGLVEWRRRPPPASRAQREPTFAVVDAAFAQRRKTLRAALAACAGSTARAESGLRAAGVDPSLRGEGLDVSDFARIAEAFAGLR